MNISFLIEMFFNILRGFLFNSKKAAPYAKWLIRIRDYLNLLFPVDTYPHDATGDLVLQKVAITPVDTADVKDAGAHHGFNIPFIKGI